MRTTEEILALQEKILNAADGRNLTDSEVSEYEALDAELKATSKTVEIQNRARAYRTPVPGQTEGYHADLNADSRELDRAFENYLRTGVPNADIANLRVSADQFAPRNAQSEGVTTAGGYLVPTTFRQKIVDVRKAFGGIESVADSLSTGDGRPVEWPSVNDTANQGAITAEGATFQGGADLVFGTVTLGAYKYTSTGTGNSPLKVSVELVQDAAFDIGDLVARKLGERIHRKEAVHFATGTGVGEPQGLVNSALTPDEDVDTPDTVDYDDLMDTYDRLDAAYEDGAVWLMKKNTWSQIRGLVDTAGRPIIQNSLEGIAGAPTKQLLGFPVVIDEAMPTLSSAADGLFIAFGNIREAYVIRRAGPVAVVVNPYTSANTGQVEYTAWERVDAAIQNRSAYVILRNDT